MQTKFQCSEIDLHLMQYVMQSTINSLFAEEDTLDQSFVFYEIFAESINSQSYTDTSEGTMLLSEMYANMEHHFSLHHDQ